MWHISNLPERTGLELWLTFVFSLLFFSFPIALGLANITTLLLLITAIFLLVKPNVRTELLTNRMVWLLVGLYAVVLVGLLYSPADWEWKGEHVNKYAKLVYAALMLILLVVFPRIQIIAFKAFVLAMLFILLSTWLNIWFLLPWSKSQSLGWGHSHHVFGDYITQNVMMSFFCTIALHYALHSKKRGWQTFWWFSTVAAAISITHLSVGRTGYVLLLTGLLSYAFIAAKGRWLWLSVVGIALASALTVASSDALQYRFIQAWTEAQKSQTNNETSIGHRLFNYSTTSKLIAEKPLIGHGTGAYHTEICRFIERKDQCDTFSWHPHNQYLFFAANNGLLGLAFFVAIIFYMFLLARRSSNRQASMLLAVLASLLMINSMINSPLWSARESHFFLYMLALMVAMSTSKSHIGSA